MAEPTRPRDIVLVVDDSPDTLSFLTDALEQSGATVLVAIDGAQALALVERITPDVILMDAVMPGMDGFETCRRLKRSSALSHVPVIFMTGLTETEHIVHGLEAGGVDYVTKPIVIDELFARIRVHLANARSAQSARAALDTAGRYLLASNRAGEVVWCTPQAIRMLSAVLPSDDGRLLLPDPFFRLLRAGSEPAAAATVQLSAPDGMQLLIAFIGRGGRDELLFRLTAEESGGQEGQLRRHFTLTVREAEVLLWIARGKSNRDIGEILGLSPRTVNKHLEQIYAKLGVENRASAAVLAAEVLSRR
ncbi:response regulator transcription factor [Methylobrevis albus]|uniref:Response regulator transcription factor n=1 Tax=Methylobrevis albus TaxID=2793297 RepID=A0A931MYN3_9HYPH|nr:response regulator transcription factor [Methylobrevis albus]MBH0238612.1 response regulator transcription factor [Methylobrevis albus]